MGRYNKLFSIFAISLMIMGLTVIASAQWRDRRGNNSNISNLKSTIRSLEGNSRIFQENLDRELDRSRYDGSRREDTLNRLAKKLRSATDELDDEYDNQRDFRNTYDEARNVISYGTQLDRALSRSRITRGSRELRRNWRNIERDLTYLGRAYRIRYNGNRYGNSRYERNDRRGNRGNQRTRRNRNTRNTRNLRSTIVSLKYKSARFEDKIDRERDNRYGRRASNNLENLSDRFNNAVKDLEDEYEDRGDYNDSYNEVRKVLSLGQQLDREVSRRGVSRDIRRDWNSIESDLRKIARSYNVSYNGRNNRSRTRVSDIFRDFPF